MIRQPVKATVVKGQQGEKPLELEVEDTVRRSSLAL
jgi:hypothetical protein